MYIPSIMGDSEFAAKDDLTSVRDVVYEHAQKLDSLSDKIDDLSKKLDDLTQKVEDLSSTVSDIQSKVGS